MKKILPLFRFLIIYWLPVIIWSLLIFSFSSRSLPKVGPSYWPDFVVKKTAHVLEYAVYSLLLYRALKNSGLKKQRAMIIAIIIAVIYAVTDEMHQSFIPVRTARVRDVIFDTFGASLPMLLIWKCLPSAPKWLVSLARNLEIS